MAAASESSSALVALLVLAGVAQGPGVLPVPMLVMPGRFHHAVECHELRCDQPPHPILHTLLDRFPAGDSCTTVGLRAEPRGPRHQPPPMVGQMRLAVLACGSHSTAAAALRQTA